MARRFIKPRELGTLVQTNLRMRPDEHAWLVEQAKHHRTTLTAEIMWRILRTRESDADLELRRTVDDIIQALDPYLVSAHERALYGRLVNAARRLVEVVAPMIAAGQPGNPKGEKVRAAIDSVHLARSAIETAVGEKVVSQGHGATDAAEGGISKAADVP